MRSLPVALCLGLLALLAPAPAPANNFHAPRGYGVVELKRLLLGAFVASWDVSGVPLGAGLGTADLEAASASLITAEYQVNDRLTVGGWFNPLRMDGRLRGRKVIQGKAEFSDLRARYALGGGLSAQVGYSIIADEFTATRDLIRNGGVAIPKGTRAGDQRGSLNFWLNKTHPISKGPRPADVYASVGYYASDDFARAVSVLAGTSIQLTPGLSFSGSVWWFNVTDTVETRITVGLTGHF